MSYDDFRIYDSTDFAMAVAQIREGGGCQNDFFNKRFSQFWLQK